MRAIAWGSGIHTRVTLPRACDRSFLWLVWFTIVHMVLVSQMLGTALATQSPSFPPAPVTVAVSFGPTALCFFSYLLLLSALGPFPGSAEIAMLPSPIGQHTKTIFSRILKPKPRSYPLFSLSFFPVAQTAAPSGAQCQAHSFLHGSWELPI